MQRNAEIVLPVMQGKSPDVLGTSKGFTLIELMVTIVVVAILAAVGMPAMGNFINQNRLSGNVNEFIGATRLARSEAIQRGGAVTICRSVAAETTTSPTCDTTTSDWKSGWLVYVGTAASTPDSTTHLILARQGPLANGITMQASSAATTPTLTSITYSAVGTPSPAPPDYFAFAFNSKFTRLVCFDPSGRTVAYPPSTTACP